MMKIISKSSKSSKSTKLLSDKEGISSNSNYSETSAVNLSSIGVFINIFISLSAISHYLMMNFI